MAGPNDNTTIIVKKIVKGGGHHGGAWKVAYADFVTAMMAFFLLMWLLNVTTSEQRRGIADYFAPTSASTSNSGAGGVMGGRSLSIDGARNSDVSPPIVTFDVPAPEVEQKEEDESSSGAEGEEDESSGGEADDGDVARKMAEREQQAFEQAERELRQAIQSVPEMQELARSLLIDNTPEGLRIQIVDQDRKSMFPSGSANMHDDMRNLMHKIADVVKRLPNQIAVSGHTDAVPFHGQNGYGNWELSADRANASRRALLETGLPAERISYVTGKADTDPLIPEEPKNPANRRISVVLLRQVPVLPPGGGR